MSKTVLDKEQLDTKEISSKEPDNAINNADVIVKNAEISQKNTKLDLTDNKSQTDDISVNDIPMEQNNSNTFSKRKYIPLICISIGILLFICIFSTAFALMNRNSTEIIKGVYINGIDVSRLTSDEASKKLTDEFSKKLNSTLALNYKDYKTELIPAQDIDANYNISVAVEKAYSIGRSGNLIQNNYEILSSLIASKKVNINLEYNAQKLDEYINNISVELPGLVENPSHYIEGQNLIIVKGHAGIKLLQDKTKELIIANIENLHTSNSIDMLTEDVEPNPIDISKVHKEVYSDPQNAYIVSDPFELNIGSDGVDFAITLDEAKELLKENKNEYIIPLKITPPEIGVEDLGNDIFVHTLGSFSSNFNVYNYNRTTNVNLATQKINNVILLPGETFSYNKVVGERTIANGFKEASVYTSSGVVNGLGGGICQVSSTLYNAVLEANLEIVERKNHRYAVSYVPLGRDATVAYGSIDFRFKNNRKYPIKVIAYTQNGVLYVSIKGIEEEVEYDVSITTKMLQKINFTTKYIEDNSMMVGTEKQTQYGDYGYKYETYKTISLNGNVISSELISTDNYTPLTRVVRVGTKQPEVSTPPVEPPPVQTPTDNGTAVPPSNDSPSDSSTADDKTQNNSGTGSASTKPTPPTNNTISNSSSSTL